MLPCIGGIEDLNDKFPGSFQADMKKRVLFDRFHEDGPYAGTIGSPDIREHLIPKKQGRFPIRTHLLHSFFISCCSFSQVHI